MNSNSTSPPFFPFPSSQPDCLTLFGQYRQARSGRTWQKHGVKFISSHTTEDPQHLFWPCLTSSSQEHHLSYPTPVSAINCSVVVSPFTHWHTMRAATSITVALVRTSFCLSRFLCSSFLVCVLTWCRCPSFFLPYAEEHAEWWYNYWCLELFLISNIEWHTNASCCTFITKLTYHY